MIETSMLLHSQCSLCIAFWNYKMLWFLIAYFSLPQVTHIPEEKNFLSRNFWCSTEKAVILLLSWSTLCIIFSAENVLNLACWFSFHFHFQIPCLFVLEFCALCERGINIFLFAEHPIFSIFNVQSVLILIADFTLSVVTQTPRVKHSYSQRSRRSAKEAMILLWHPEKWPESW